MNKEDNYYQSLRGNVPRINDVTNDDESTYTELSRKQLSIVNLIVYRTTLAVKTN